jgi:wyosine [tRNA(Phe)-imidazoG37] synthetase (radical SAM superfamily)
MVQSAQLAFGPIVSRRFGRSLGVNNIPAKHCSYSCLYCQVGTTRQTEHIRRRYFEVSDIVSAVERRVEDCLERDEPIDVISIVPNGEPTLDLRLGDLIRELKRFDLPVAVITNGSLLWLPEVRRDLAEADIVSVEIDTVDDSLWRKLDRPVRGLQLEGVLRGIARFAMSFRGRFETQTMLVSGLNDDGESLARTASFIASIAPARAWLAVPTRPPAEAVVRPRQQLIDSAWIVTSSKLPQLELLCAPAQDVLPRGANLRDVLLSTLAVHPLSEDAVRRDLTPRSTLIEDLVEAGSVERIDYEGKRFLVLTEATADC